MTAGTAKIDITPSTPVWMDGMIREHKSEGVHDPIFARALFMVTNDRVDEACAIVSVDVCGLKSDDIRIVRDSASVSTGIPSHNIVIAATHTHSGPAAIGFFNPKEDEYLDELIDKLITVIEEAAGAARPVIAGCASGCENTISHYRRLLAVNGQVIMNWEPYPQEKILGPLGVIDPEVGVLALADAENPADYVGILYNHAGHPNVLSGDNYLISGDYPGLASRLLEAKYGCTAIFLNGAQGTMDIDGLRDRARDGVERTGKALADSVSGAVKKIEFSQDMELRTGFTRYSVPPRKISQDELSWLQQILEKTGGTVGTLADGVGDDYKALLYQKLHEKESGEIDIEQTCIAVGGTAFITFPGELLTEIGMHIKSKSPFERTLIIGLANGEIGYVPTRKAIREGGYAVDTREVDDTAEDIIVAKSCALLEKVYSLH